MKKKILLALMVITLSLIALGAISVSAETYGKFTYTVSNREVTITGYKSSYSDPSQTIIPETIGGYPVTAIADEAFMGSHFEKVIIPNSVETIGNGAFSGCRDLISVTIPGSVTTIGEGPFSVCSDLTTINVDSNNTKYTSFNGNLYNKDKTTLIQYANGKTEAYFEIPDGVTTIGNRAFAQSNLTSVTIPASVTTIGNRAFAQSNLTSVTIPASVITIGDEAFRSIANIASITIPDSVTTIGAGAFAGCNSLTSIDVDSNNTKYTSFNGNLYNKDKTTLIQYANGKTEAYFEIPDGVTTIGNGAFYWCNKLTGITIPDSVTIVGDEAFCDCNNLASVTIPDSVTAIGKKAFYECNKLASVIIGKGITTIDYETFAFCNNLESIIIGKNVNTIGDMAFYYCSKLADVYYNGTQEEWEKIAIYSSNVVNNKYLKNATKKFFWYVTLFDNTENKISNKMYNIGTVLDISDAEVPEGYALAGLYIDKERTILYDIKTPINENLILYVDFVKLNTLEFGGTTTADIGEKGITQKVSFATDKETKYFSCTIKVPNSLKVQEIKSDIFEIEQDYELIGNDTYYYLFLIYNGDGNIPTSQKITPFEVVLDVSENAVADEILTIEILDDAILADDNGNSYEFTNIEKAEIKINPIFAEEITIVGADEIDKPTQYTVSVLPENTTNPNVEWSVSDEAIATISEDGILTPVKKGNVTIKATAKDGSGIYAEKIVSVKVPGTVNSIATNIGTWDKEYTPNTTNYTIYVPENTTSIRLTAKHAGTLKTDKTTFVNNVARTVTLSTTSDETVLDLSYTCDGYDNNKYTITIVKFEGTKTEISEDKKSFTITPINIENGKTVILALYDENGLAEMQSLVYTGEPIPFTTTKEYANAKVFVWKNFETLVPVCEAEIVK